MFNVFMTLYFSLKPNKLCTIFREILIFVVIVTLRFLRLCRSKSQTYLPCLFTTYPLRQFLPETPSLKQNHHDTQSHHNSHFLLYSHLHHHLYCYLQPQPDQHQLQSLLSLFPIPIANSKSITNVPQ